jgi:hypothetical protein
MDISSIFPDFYFAYSWCILIAILVLPFHKDKKQVLQFVVWCNLWLALLSLMNGFAWYETMTSDLRNILFRQRFDDWFGVNRLIFDKVLIIAPMQLFWIRLVRENLVASCLIALHLQMNFLVAVTKNTSIDYSGIVWTISYEQTNMILSSNPDFIPSGWSWSSYYINILSTALGVGIFTLLLFLIYTVLRYYPSIKLKKILEL